MKRHRLGLFILFLGLVSCDRKHAANDGHIVGNGGDYVENLFVQGKLQAVRVLQKLKATPSEDLKRDSTIGSGADLATLQGRADELIESIGGGKHHWSQKLPAGCPYSTCGCTLPNRPREVFLSYDNCRETKTYGQAGSVLLHEATHAVLKADEDTARQLTSVAYELWGRWGHPDTPHWRHATIPREIGVALTRPVQIGEEILYLNDSGHWRFHPGKEEWKRLDIANAEPDLIRDREGWFFAHNVPLVVGGRATVFAQCWKSQMKRGAGFAIDPKNSTEIVLPSEGAPSSRRRVVQAASSDLLFVWGGEQCEEDLPKAAKGIEEYIDGAVFSFKNGWSKVTSVGAPAFSREMRAAWSGEEFVLWDGGAKLHRFHPQLNKWLRPLSMDFSSADWAMGAVEGGVIILTQTHATVYRGGQSLETSAISSPPITIELSSSSAYYGRSEVGFYVAGIMTFNVDSRNWAFLTSSPYPRNSYLHHIFYTGSEYILLPLHFIYREDSYGAIFYR